jgi:predicted ATPase/DNA-binding SARP family transcriptional activator
LPEGNRVEIGLRKSIALFAYLAVSKKPYDRDFLAALFWPEDAHRTALGNLRRALYRINHAIGCDLFKSTRKTVQCCPENHLWIDVDAFIHKVNSPAPWNTKQLAQAVDLYAADFMSGFSLPDSPEFDEWQFFQSEGLRRSLHTALERLVSMMIDQADWDQAVLYARRWVSLDPLQEKPRRILMDLFSRLEQVPSALRQYDELTMRLREELGLTPETETTDLYERIKRQHVSRDKEHAPSVTSGLTGPSTQRSFSPGPVHNLPAQTSIFIERKTELESIHHLLAEDPNSRLLTIIGPGGIGKTRLAIEVAYRALRSFPDGVCFVPLAALASPDHIISAIIENLGLRFFDERYTERYLIQYLQEKHLLLVLDNAEYLLAGMGIISRILQAATGVKVLVTSRERLNLMDEITFILGAMAYPEQDSDSEPLDYGAVQLLVHYARMARPGLILDRQALEGAVRICRLVQGMPLALVLAAGWMEVLSFPEIAEEISQSFDFLESETRDLPERQRSVRAAFVYSWKRLSPDEQAVFACLSVFREGFTRKAAEAVAGTSLRTLRNLIDRSFISLGQNGKYEVHELLRQFGEEYLFALGKAEDVYTAHSRYFLTLVAGLEQEIKGANLFRALDQIESELENIRSAWGWAAAHRDDAAIDGAVESLYLYFALRSRYKEGAEFLGSAHHQVQPKPGEKQPSVCGRVLARYAWILSLHSKPDEKIERHIQRSLDLAIHYQNQSDIAFAFLLYGCYYMIAKQDSAGALAHLEHSYALYRAIRRQILHRHCDPLDWFMSR